MKRRMWALLLMMTMFAMLTPVLSAWAEELEPVLVVETMAAASPEPGESAPQTQNRSTKTRGRLAGRTANTKAAARSTDMSRRTSDSASADRNDISTPVQEHTNAPTPKPEFEIFITESTGNETSETRSVPKPMPETIAIALEGEGEEADALTVRDGELAETGEETPEENAGENAENPEAIILLDTDEEAEDVISGYTLTQNDFAINVRQPTMAVRQLGEEYTLEGDLVIVLNITNSAPCAAQVRLTPTLSDETLTAYARLGLRPAQTSEGLTIASGESADVEFDFVRDEAVTLSAEEAQQIMNSEALFFPVGISMSV